MSVSRGPLRVVLCGVAALLTVLGGCAHTHIFDRYVQEGLYEDALHTFESDSTLWVRPDAVLVIGQIFADPSMPTYDPDRGRGTLQRLIDAFPQTPEAAQARTLLSLTAVLENVQRELAARSAEIARLGAQQTQQADTLAATQQAAALERETLQRQIRRLEMELEEARRELERLKAIDLRRRPDGRR